MNVGHFDSKVRYKKEIQNKNIYQRNSTLDNLHTVRSLEKTKKIWWKYKSLEKVKIKLRNAGTVQEYPTKR